MYHYIITISSERYYEEAALQICDFASKRSIAKLSKQPVKKIFLYLGLISNLIK